MVLMAPLLTVILSASLLTRTLADAAVSCAHRKVLPFAEGVHYTFLRTPPRQSPPSPRLYHLSWSRGRALLSCAWSDDGAVIRDYSSLCRERALEFSDHLEEDLDAGSLLGAEGSCISVSSPKLPDGLLRSAGHAVGISPPGVPRQGSKVRSHRVKRGFIVPGTLWCGSGNKAPSLGDLGLFTETDSCCREHDQCKNTILSFHSKFGVFNSNIFTMSHCDCDRKFHSCLTEARDSISDVVGYTFFNLLQMHCFEFSRRLQCTQRNWFGMCKESKLALYAEVHPPALYEAPTPPAPLNASVSLNATEGPTRSSTSPPPPPFDASAGSAPPRTSPPTSVPGAPTARSGVERPPAPVTDPEKTAPPGKQPAPDLRGMQQACSVYKDLDQCETKIPPQQMRFGLRNTANATLYHCNCTSRLFQMLADQRQLAEVHAALLGRLSLSCFLPQNCTAGKICAAVQMSAQLPQPVHQSGADAGKQRPLPAARVIARRPKRRDGEVKLHKVCLRTVGKLRAGWKNKSRELDKDSQQAGGRQ